MDNDPCTEALTKWTYFFLGRAILLPWNGDIFFQLYIFN